MCQSPLTRDEPERPPIDLLRPYDAGEMAAYPVDPRVGNVRNNEPGLCDTYECPPNSAWRMFCSLHRRQELTASTALDGDDNSNYRTAASAKDYAGHLPAKLLILSTQPHEP